MKCNRCGKIINEFELYCDNCKNIVLREEEFNKQVEENKKLNELEITKELIDLDKLVNENNELLKDELKNIVKSADFEVDINEDKRKSKIIIIFSIVIISIIIFITMLIVLLNKKEPEKQVNEIDYEKIINNYGDSINLFVSNYLKDNQEIPSWFNILESINYEGYDIVCNVHSVYKDGNIYLNECSIDGKPVEYSYGMEQQEIIGKSIGIYKSDNFVYNENEDGVLQGYITCKTQDCEFINAYEKYALIKEANKYYLYDYINDSLEFGPFNIIDDNYNNNVLVYENILYGILYEEENIKKIYNVNLNKILKNIQGELITNTSNSSIMYKYGYAIFQEDNKNNFVNLKTGNVSYSIDGILGSFIESGNKNLVYITKYNSNSTKIMLYNSNGKKLFDGKEFNQMIILENDIMLSNDNNFYIYDSNLQLKFTSKKYDNILKLYNDFVVVVDNQYLSIVDINDKILATFDLKWDSDIYFLNSDLSGWDTKNYKYGIYLMVENRAISYGTIGSSLECYYIPSMEDIGIIELDNVSR